VGSFCALLFFLIKGIASTRYLKLHSDFSSPLHIHIRFISSGPKPQKLLRPREKLSSASVQVKFTGGPNIITGDYTLSSLGPTESTFFVVFLRLRVSFAVHAALEISRSPRSKRRRETRNSHSARRGERDLCRGTSSGRRERILS